MANVLFLKAFNTCQNTERAERTDFCSKTFDSLMLHSTSCYTDTLATKILKKKKKPYTR